MQNFIVDLMYEPFVHSCRCVCLNEICVCTLMARLLSVGRAGN